ncbi:hypothetical protein SSAG_01010 [Streptomyces sp. Mg1]|nr:hypothetical protein SSAG_01010 [Streptomyces sp. Mg1]
MNNDLAPMAKVTPEPLLFDVRRARQVLLGEFVPALVSSPSKSPVSAGVPVRSPAAGEFMGGWRSDLRWGGLLSHR